MSNIVIRRAEEKDAAGIAKIAEAVAFKRIITETFRDNGWDTREIEPLSGWAIKTRLKSLIPDASQYPDIEARLNRAGYLLCALDGESATEPDYRERIKLSKHFWVAADGEEIAGFLMAWHLAEFEGIAKKTEDDKSIIADYLRGPAKYNPEGLLIQQVATSPSYQGLSRKSGEPGIMRRVMTQFLESASTAPFVMAEICDGNEASTRFFRNNAMPEIFRRDVDGITTVTVMRTLNPVS